MRMFAEKNDKRRQVIMFVLVALISFTIGANIRNIIPIATVNGEGISRTEFLKKLLKSNGEAVLNGMVTEKLILQEAKRQKVTIDKKDVDARIKQIERDLKRQGQTLQGALVVQKETLQELRGEVRLQLLVEKMFKTELTIRDGDIERYFKDNHIVRGTGAILESQLVSIREQLYAQKLRQKFLDWLAVQTKNAKVKIILKT